MFKAIPYSKVEHLPIAQKWWKEHGWPKEDDDDYLSSLGVVITFNDKPIAMVWIYRIADCKACWLGWPIADRYADREVRNFAIDHLIKSATAMVQELGFKRVWTTASAKKLQNRLMKAGYSVGDQNVNYYAMRF